MKIGFAGPTLSGLERTPFASIEFRPPAQCGDVAAAVRDGARVIGLIDGVFEHQPSVWHKEILFALSEGMIVAGAASMGALRAAECQAFGMIGVGAVFEAYASGALEDDADVAQAHGPAEVGYLPLSQPLVNVRATLAHLLALDRITDPEHDSLLAAASGLFFKDRTDRAIVESAELTDARRAAVVGLLKSHSVNIKRQDACDMLQRIEQDHLVPPGNQARLDWQLASTRSLRNIVR